MERAKKDCILDAAVKAFARLGFKKASIDDIARAAGVAKGTVYLACESKEDLFYQAVNRDLRALVGEVGARIDPRRGADELLREVANASLEFMDGHPLARGLFVGQYHGLFPAWEAQFRELRALGHANVVEILRLGQRQGQFRADLDVESTASVLQDLMIAGYVDQTRAPEPAAMARKVKAALDLVLDGLRVRPA